VPFPPVLITLQEQNRNGRIKWWSSTTWSDIDTSRNRTDKETKRRKYNETIDLTCFGRIPAQTGTQQNKRYEQTRLWQSWPAWLDTNTSRSPPCMGEWWCSPRTPQSFEMYCSGVPVILSNPLPDLVISLSSGKSIIHNPTNICMKGAIGVEKAVHTRHLEVSVRGTAFYKGGGICTTTHKSVGLTDLVSFPCVPIPALNSLVTNWAVLWNMRNKLSFIQHGLCTVHLQQGIVEHFGLSWWNLT